MAMDVMRLYQSLGSGYVYFFAFYAFVEAKVRKIIIVVDTIDC